MARYIDGFVLPIPSKNLDRYKRMSTKASKVWLEHGALEYYETVGDDLTHEGIAFPFTRMARTKPGETVIFAWIVYRSRAHRDQVNKKVMADPRLAAMMPGKDEEPIMDHKRMAYGGFEMLVYAPGKRSVKKR